MSRCLRADTDADLLILGGGLAGLSLAAALARRGYPGRVRIVEPRLDYADDRSWTFWARESQPQPVPPEQQWSQWQVGLAGEASTSCSAPGWRYSYVRASSVYAEARRVIAAAPRLHLHLGQVATVVSASAVGLRVETTDGALYATQVVDTRPPGREQMAGATLFQVFAGREIAVAHDAFDTGSIELMGDLRCDADGLVFTYLLPLTRRRALVEVTRFAPRSLPRLALERDLDQLLASRRWSTATVLRREFAVLPMGLPQGSALPRGAVRAGIAGGGLRAASGYGYQRIRGWAERCAATLVQGGVAVGHPPEPRLRRAMDALFLQVLRRAPERAPELLFQLASRLDGASFVRFMSDRAGLADCARVVAALPPGPFLRALVAGNRRRIQWLPR